MVEFRNPYLSFLAVIALIVWTLDYYHILKRPQIFFPHSFFNSLSKRRFDIKRHFLYLCGVLSWVLIGIALAGPRIPLDFIKNKLKANDLYFVVDVSRSMLAEDFKPNRIEVAKEKISDFIKLRPSDRIGIIIFSREVFTLMPLTTDLSLIDQVIGDITVGRLGSATNIGDALGLAVARLMRSQSKNKIIILMTDGVSNAGNMAPREAAKFAAKQKIKIYSIGIGSSKGAKLPLGNTPFGKQYQNVPGGSIDLELLKDMAKLTEGKSYLAENESALNDIFGEINALEKSEIDISGRTVYKENYLKYLVSGLWILVLVEIFRKKIVREIS
ncbi:MAG: VWA domain-containing protein [Bacteriovoracales bacterium]|nr:VWA domain-containing protein [Bacteriovoracales bacterium]